MLKSLSVKQSAEVFFALVNRKNLTELILYSPYTCIQVLPMQSQLGALHLFQVFVIYIHYFQYRFFLKTTLSNNNQLLDNLKGGLE